VAVEEEVEARSPPPAKRQRKTSSSTPRTPRQQTVATVPTAPGAAATAAATPVAAAPGTAHPLPRATGGSSSALIVHKSQQFLGARPGHEFKLGTQGLGACLAFNAVFYLNLSTKLANFTNARSGQSLFCLKKVRVAMDCRVLSDGAAARGAI
jgi:hypothetical protein